MPDTIRRYGLLLPHFGEHASRRNLLEMAQTAERYGFDSVWVRDHLVFHPHGMEGQDRTHVDPMVTLGLVAGVTDKLILGTGSLIPYRHPIQAALALSSLEHVAGPGRVIAGFGIGTFDHEFNAAGLAGIDRRELIAEQGDVMRRLWTGDEIDYHGKYYSFEKVDVHPSPAGPHARRGGVEGQLARDDGAGDSRQVGAVRLGQVGVAGGPRGRADRRAARD